MHIFFSYKPISEYPDDVIRPEIKVETALTSYAFPTEIKSVDSLSYGYLIKNHKELAEEFGLAPFDMRVQSLNRTFIDKIFALCDYYMEGKSKRYSRHLYDLYKLRPLVPLNGELKKLVIEVRKHRSKLSICPSAKADVDIQKKIYEFCDNEFYKADYNEITEYFTSEQIPYKDIVCNIKEIASELF